MAIYFDNSATTMVDPIVRDAMIPFFTELYGNPSSIHSIGRVVRPHVDAARESVAKLLNADANEIIFTASGTESDNLAIISTARALKHKGKHIITSVIEHKAVLETCKYLEAEEGFEVSYIPVDNGGLLDMDAYKAALRDDTILVSIMFANNEIGTVQPIKEIATLASEKGAIVHTDAVQAVGKIDINVSELGIHMLSFSGHKIYAPKGIGALYIDSELREKIQPLIHGGQQEGGLRAGTENIPYIVGLGKACEILNERIQDDIAHTKALRDRFEERVLAEIPETYVNGCREKRVPSISDITFRFIEGEALMVYARDICCSAGSACTSVSSSPSHVLSAININEIDFHGALRFSFGRFNTMEEVEKAVDILIESVAKLRMMSPLYNG